MQSFVK